MANRPQFTSSWTCSNGHVTEVAATLLEDGSYVRGSAWDCCDECSESPTAPETLRMWDEIDEQAKASGSMRVAQRAKLITEAHELIAAVDDIHTLDVLAGVLAEQRANLVARDQDLRLRDEHLRTNRRVLTEAGLMSSQAGEFTEVLRRVSNRALAVHDVLDECALAIRRVGIRADRADELDGVTDRLETAASWVAGLAADGVTGKFGVYVHGKRWSLNSMREWAGRLTLMLEDLRTRDTSGDSPGEPDQ